jgi:hypothetical protein
VANTQRGEYKGKKGGGNYPRKKFNPSMALNGPCILQSRDGRATTHTTDECFQFHELDKFKNSNGEARDQGLGITEGSLNTFTITYSKTERKKMAHGRRKHPRWCTSMVAMVRAGCAMEPRRSLTASRCPGQSRPSG